jgi:outer membrane murein-binding lipoprotein Lpp
MKEFMKKWGMTILAVIFFLLFMGRGCTSIKISKVNTNVDSVEMHVDSLEQKIVELEDKTISKKEMKDEFERTMLDFLIYEDDLDRGKTSLSAIKNKIEAND